MQIMGQEPAWKDILMHTLQDLSALLEDENTVSAYELHSSGLIQALLKMFAIESKNRKSSKLQRQTTKFSILYLEQKEGDIYLFSILPLKSKEAVDPGYYASPALREETYCLSKK